ncbi:MAG: hypothetical protein [Bacteriophage sp.]|nr:MAG: hypothetical protein [Bacteriophage sp.]
MTFDEALNELEPRTIWSNEMRDLLEQLRQEYAPTVEMTKEEKEYYASRTLLSGLVFNQNTQYYTDEVFNIDRRTAIAILHPETIKIVDE